MGSKESQGDYRNFLISKWATKNIESFKKPTLQDLENQVLYYKHIIETVLPSQKDLKILEIGCGWGGNIYTLKKLGYNNVDAVDVIPQCCNFVKEELKVKNVVCADIFEFFKGNNKRYDVIIAFDVLEHFYKSEIISLVSNIYEILNPTGIFIMKSPCAGSPLGIFVRYSGFTHETAFTSLSINELFKAIGFNEVYCIPEPKLKRYSPKSLIKKFLVKIMAKLLSLDSKFIDSANIIGVGIK
jgi:cyclopropane fatty-acyl-phospholipid synthase-like methyltransferase